MRNKNILIDAKKCSVKVNLQLQFLEKEPYQIRREETKKWWMQHPHYSPGGPSQIRKNVGENMGARGEKKESNFYYLQIPSAQKVCKSQLTN